ncbi:MAG: hypothetical protein H0U76_20205 [Ktedonobacteraceae bacterium]|nr:hypothetical protein [Ktedonobacteraceae bacterium]
MNALLCKPCAATETDVCSIPDWQEDFATGPMQAVQPENSVIDEEALHLSFEEAIRDRTSALSTSWQVARPALASTSPLRDTAVEHALLTLTSKDAEPSEQERVDVPDINWQRGITYVCIALMLVLIGFDLMGLLILRLH